MDIATAASSQDRSGGPGVPPGRLGLRAAGLYGLQVALIAVVFAAAAVFGLTWSIMPGAGTPIWPASGVALAALILGGVRLWPGVFLGRLLTAAIIHSPQPWWADLLIAAANALGAAAPAWSLARFGWFTGSLTTLHEMLALVIDGAAGALISAAPSLLVLWASGTSAVNLRTAGFNWTLGNACGVVVLTPLILSWSRRDAWRMTAGQAAHLAACLLAVLGVAYLIFFNPPVAHMPTWYLFPVLIWTALAFSVRGVAAAMTLVAALTVWSSVRGVGPFLNVAPTAAGQMFFSQQFVAITALTMLVLAAVADERRGRQRIAQSERRLQAETQALEILNATGSAIAAELELDALVQTVTDAGVALTGAAFGAFFYNVTGAEGENYTLFSVSGAPRAAFEPFGMPRNTELFAATFEGAGVVRSADITADPRYGRNAPHQGMPQGHPPVRSYLATPVKSRSGKVIGALFFGHPEADVFTERAERMAVGIAGQAAVALDNARLYHAAQEEIAERERIEARQELLINELNHRVKNTLATVQSIADQSLRSQADVGEAKDALTARIIALSRAHDVITARTWRGADLGEIVARAVQPFDTAGGARLRAEGPAVWLTAGAALAISMALHELGTNAAKYGALSSSEGQVSVTWSVSEEGLLRLVWTERGGPRVQAPRQRGFGSRLIERGLMVELGGEARLTFEEDGVVCEIVARLPSTEEGAARHDRFAAQA